MNLQFKVSLIFNKMSNSSLLIVSSKDSWSNDTSSNFQVTIHSTNGQIVRGVTALEVKSIGFSGFTGNLSDAVIFLCCDQVIASATTDSSNPSPQILQTIPITWNEIGSRRIPTMTGMISTVMPTKSVGNIQGMRFHFLDQSLKPLDLGNNTVVTMTIAVHH